MKRITIGILIATLQLFGCRKKENLEACFSADNQKIITNQIVNFSNCSTEGEKFEWNFEDGEESTIANPSHAFDEKGSFQVKLTSYNKEQEAGESIINVDVYNAYFKKAEIIKSKKGYHQTFVIEDIYICIITIVMEEYMKLIVQ